ncbi:MAG: hypothetical protein CVV27_21400, partial [Candidatus Melainabacteria bacterium HGW-Melainabacteria-1]
MIQRKHSPFLEGQKSALEKLVAMLAGRFDYISVLGTDDRGISYAATPGETRSSEPMWVQRGFVFRAQKDGKVAEFALPLLETSSQAALTATADTVATALDSLLDSPDAISYPPIPDEPLVADYRGSIGEDPFVADPETILARLG